LEILPEILIITWLVYADFRVEVFSVLRERIYDLFGGITVLLCRVLGLIALEVVGWRFRDGGRVVRASFLYGEM